MIKTFIIGIILALTVFVAAAKSNTATSAPGHIGGGSEVSIYDQGQFRYQTGLSGPDRLVVTVFTSKIRSIRQSGGYTVITLDPHRINVNSW